MTDKLTALPPGSWTLVTGANGYIGSRIADTLLQLGFRVRGTIRAPKPWLNEMFDKKYGSGMFETVTVANFDDKEAVGSAMKGMAGVIHVVSVW